MKRTSAFSLLSLLPLSAFVALGRASRSAVDVMLIGLGVSDARGISADGSVVVGGNWAGIDVADRYVSA